MSSAFRHRTARTFRSALISIAALSTLAVSHGRALAQTPGRARSSGDALEQGFVTPPDSAKPRAWWHWMNGNVTKEGITADLEWMKRVGIGGMQMFDGNLGTPVFVDKRLVWMTPEWKDAFRHAAAEADRLGLEMAMAASGGWSETGGPSVTPEMAMKKVVWSETRVAGPKKLAAALPKPPSVNGTFQDVPVPPPFHFPQAPPPRGAKPQPTEEPPAPDPTFYGDIAVLAYRMPEGDVRMADRHPKVTASGGAGDLSILVDGDLDRQATIPVAEDGKAWVQLEFAEPYTARAFTIATGAAGSPFGGESIPRGELQASADGTHFVTVVILPGPGHPFAGFPVRTWSFAEKTARVYRLLLEPPGPGPIQQMMGLPAPREVKLADIELFSCPRVDRWEGKAAFQGMTDTDALPTPPVAAALAIPRGEVVDLTSRMGTDGSLDWDVPAGNWVILRLGCSLTGHKNGPASREATGFEVDKLSAKHVRAYMDGYLGTVSEALGPLFGKSFRYLLMDSWEAGLENWTDDMVSEFQKRRGYDPKPYLPVLTGRVVDSADASDRFLWDFRRTIADLLAENHYGLATEMLHERKLGLYAEAMGAGLPTTGDGLQDKGRVDIPMGEFWVRAPGVPHTPEHPTDVREAASAAHTYGKTLVAVEAFTTGPPVSGWQPPSYLKRFADYYFAQGMNRIVFHTSDHQPFVDGTHKPGITLAVFGQHYTRNNTWAEPAVAWNTYLARCSHMLQQGQFVGDLAYYYGEGAPVTIPFWKTVRPEPPAGYGYDYVDTEVLLNRMSAKDGRLVLPDGVSYRVLVLPEDVDRLTAPVARKIRDLVADGATVVAPRPRGSPSLAGYPAADEEVRAIANEVWGAIEGGGVTEHAYGKGKVYWGIPLEQVLAREKTSPDVLYNRPGVDTTLVWIHRRTAHADIYFVANQKDGPEDLEASFRVQGKEAELWQPVTGAMEAGPYSTAEGRTAVPLHLDPYGSVFVVFRRTGAPSRTIAAPKITPLATVEGPWTLAFAPDWGAPPRVTLPRLGSWTDSQDAGVKYFSGTATYTKDIQVPGAWLRRGSRLILDLGDVRELAEVSVNDKPVGIVWTPPFRVDVTGAVRSGSNHVVIKVTNLWSNRLIGDQELPPEKRLTFSTYDPYDKTSTSGRRIWPGQLLPSGLLGPVAFSLSTRP
jgi:hypothetical protein